jgi:hypothetical protein
MNAWCVLIGTTVRHETDSSAHAIAMAKAERADGNREARLGKWCPACKAYRGNFVDRCKVCAGKARAS